MRNKKILLVMPIAQSTVLPGIKRALSYLNLDYRIFDYRDLNLAEKLFNVSNRSELANWSMNRRLAAVVEEWLPRLIFVVKGSVILPETLSKIRKQGVLTVNWFPDDIQAYDLAKKIAPWYDIFLHFDPYAVKQLKKDLVSHGKIDRLRFGADILPTDTEIKMKTRRYNLSLIGNPYPIREQRLPAIADLGLEIWGSKDWRQTSLRKNYHHFLPYSMVNSVLLETEIGLNLQFESPGAGLVNRAYEVIAAKAMLLNNPQKDLLDLFEVGKEVVCFNNNQQLREQVMVYLADSERRIRIAERGYWVVRNKYTYVHRFRELFTDLNI